MQSHKIPHGKAKDLHQPKKSYTAIYLILLKILTAGKKKIRCYKKSFYLLYCNFLQFGYARSTFCGLWSSLLPMA